MIMSFLIGLFVGFSFGLCLVVIVWNQKQAEIDKLAAMLSTPLGDLVTKRQR